MINPYKIWWMVVLISGLNFASYILVKVVGAEHGIGLTGLLGGLVSSTAVTLGFAQRSRTQPEQAPALALGILVAWTVMFFRVVLLAAVIAPALARRLLPGIGALGALSLAIVLVLRRSAALGGARERLRRREPLRARRGDPLRRLVRRGDLRGEGGAGRPSATPGSTSPARSPASPTWTRSRSRWRSSRRREPASSATAARVVLIAVLSNTLVKGGMAVLMGGAALRRVMLPFTAAVLAAGAVVAWLL